MEAVKIYPIKSGAGIRRLPIVVVAEPADKIEDIGVAPHPERITSKVFERFFRRSIFSNTANVPVHAICVGEIGFDCDRRKIIFFDQPASDRRTMLIELVRSMRGLAEKDEIRLGAQLD